MDNCKVNILGTEYSICFVETFPEYLSDYEDDSDALFNSFNREIYVKIKKEKDITEQGRDRILKKNLRHEILHGFLYESGLSSNTYGHIGGWAEHEEMIDWFAIQSPKIFMVFKELDIL